MGNRLDVTFLERKGVSNWHGADEQVLKLAKTYNEGNSELATLLTLEDARDQISKDTELTELAKQHGGDVPHWWLFKTASDYLKMRSYLMLQSVSSPSKSLEEYLKYHDENFLSDRDIQNVSYLVTLGVGAGHSSKVADNDSLAVLFDVVEDSGSAGAEKDIATETMIAVYSTHPTETVEYLLERVSANKKFGRVLNHVAAEAAKRELNIGKILAEIKSRLKPDDSKLAAIDAADDATWGVKWRATVLENNAKLTWVLPPDTRALLEKFKMIGLDVPRRGDMLEDYKRKLSRFLYVIGHVRVIEDLKVAINNPKSKEAKEYSAILENPVIRANISRAIEEFMKNQTGRWDDFDDKLNKTLQGMYSAREAILNKMGEKNYLDFTDYEKLLTELEVAKLDLEAMSGEKLELPFNRSTLADSYIDSSPELLAEEFDREPVDFGTKVKELFDKSSDIANVVKEMSEWICDTEHMPFCEKKFSGDAEILVIARAKEVLEAMHQIKEVADYIKMPAKEMIEAASLPTKGDDNWDSELAKKNISELICKRNASVCIDPVSGGYDAQKAELYVEGVINALNIIKDISITIKWPPFQLGMIGLDVLAKSNLDSAEALNSMKGHICDDNDKDQTCKGAFIKETVRLKGLQGYVSAYKEVYDFVTDIDQGKGLIVEEALPKWKQTKLWEKYAKKYFDIDEELPKMVDVICHAGMAKCDNNDVKDGDVKDENGNPLPFKKLVAENIGDFFNALRAEQQKEINQIVKSYSERLDSRIADGEALVDLAQKRKWNELQAKINNSSLVLAQKEELLAAGPYEHKEAYQPRLAEGYLGEWRGKEDLKEEEEYQMERMIDKNLSEEEFEESRKEVRQKRLNMVVKGVVKEIFKAFVNLPSELEPDGKKLEILNLSKELIIAGANRGGNRFYTDLELLGPLRENASSDYFGSGPLVMQTGMMLKSKGVGPNQPDYLMESIFEHDKLLISFYNVMRNDCMAFTEAVEEEVGSREKAVEAVQLMAAIAADAMTVPKIMGRIKVGEKIFQEAKRKIAKNNCKSASILVETDEFVKIVGSVENAVTYFGRGLLNEEADPQDRIAYAAIVESLGRQPDGKQPALDLVQRAIEQNDNEEVVSVATVIRQRLLA